jgi:hypothetical protein
MAKITAIKETRKVKVTQEARGGKSPATADEASKSRAGGRSPADKKQGDRGPASSPSLTSGRECTGRRKPV